ncbi:MAG: zinc ABC transporter substrate-binding protein [Rhodococcus sp.]|nr:zinc ABC transporter substrate-binding protein [Rhodococcus sp. (in: high G+C Gram-positive bacteria)]
MRQLSVKVFSVAATVVAAVLVSAGLSACSIAGGSDGPLVVVTTNILGDVVENIVGEEADVMVLMPRGADPHSFEISAAEAHRVEQADVIIANGLGLEGGLGKIVDTARGDGVPVLDVGSEVDPITYSAGQSSGSLDPHFWTDPYRMIAAIPLIEEAVVAHVPGVDSSQIADNAQRYRGELDELAAQMSQQFDEIPPSQRKLVTNHHVFGYLAERFEFEVIGAVVPSGTTLASPSASDLAELAGAISAAGVPTIFIDSSQPDRLAQVLAAEASTPVQVRSLFTESLGDEGDGGDTYIDMMRSNTQSISDGLTAN